MRENLDRDELVRLVRRVFRPTDRDTGLLILADVPDDRVPDNPAWAERRRLAAGWAAQLDAARAEIPVPRVTLAWYRNAGGNNADLPETAVTGLAAVPDHVSALPDDRTTPLADLLASHSIVLAPTELSATAPLKVAARRWPLRAATMPGFLPAMIPALRLDYTEVNRRVQRLKEMLDAADTALLRTVSPRGEHELRLDLRFRTAHASGGLFPDNGTAGNLPSGEAYIVPYEGERPGEPSRTAGELPVQFPDGLLVYTIAENRVLTAAGDEAPLMRESRQLAREPGYRNVAELGLGVLGELGVRACGSVLLDEKLGVHVAFGRSDHFGGTVGPDAFSSPAAVVHVDRVYIPDAQPDVTVAELTLSGPDGERRLMTDGRWEPDLFA